MYIYIYIYIYHTLTGTQGQANGAYLGLQGVMSGVDVQLILSSWFRKEKTTPFGVNLMRSPVLYRAAQGVYGLYTWNLGFKGLKEHHH